MRRLIYSQLPLPLGTLPRSHRGQGVEAPCAQGDPPLFAAGGLWAGATGKSIEMGLSAEKTVDCLIIYAINAAIRNSLRLDLRRRKPEIASSRISARARQ